MEKKFGQHVTLKVVDASGEEVFKTSELRVDFDIRHLDGFGRGTIVIYNLSRATIESLADGENYASITTRLHDGPSYVLADEYFISNILEEKKVPNSITTLYCFDKLRKTVLERQIDVKVYKPTLKKVLKEICDAGMFLGSVKFQNFPEGLTDQRTGRRYSNHAGTLQECISSLQKTHKFSMYTNEGDLHMVYSPDLDEVKHTDLPDKDPDIVINIINMRANPKIGPGSLNITSNLDPRIKGGSILDIAKLFELNIIGTNLQETSLRVSPDQLNNQLGFSKYQVTDAIHKGSNYTSEWRTVVTATSPTRGNKMPILSWQGGK